MLARRAWIGRLLTLVRLALLPKRGAAATAMLRYEWRMSE